MKAPTIHLNGSDGEILADGYCEVSSAISEALNAMAHAAPNGRDYYTQGPDAFTQANAEHQEMIERLSVVQRWAAGMAENIMDQVDKRSS
jgi:hypothetical protein